MFINFPFNCVGVFFYFLLTPSFIDNLFCVLAPPICKLINEAILDNLIIYLSLGHFNIALYVKYIPFTYMYTPKTIL